MKQPSLSRRVLLYLLCFAILGVLGSAVIWGHLEYTRFQEETARMRRDYLKTKHDEVRRKGLASYAYAIFKKKQAAARLKSDLKSRTYEAVATANHIFQKNMKSKSKAEIAVLIGDALHAPVWDDGKGYYFAEDMKGTELINRNNPELIGTSLIDLQDSKGVYIMRRILKVAGSKEGEGFCTYHWNKPGATGVLLPKISFVKYFKPLNWVIGTGKYLRDEEQEIQQEIIEHFDSMRDELGYYTFAATYTGKGLTYPVKGMDLIDMQDSDGKYITREMIKAAKAGGGFVEYVLPKLGNERPARKLSYIKGVPGWDWYIGYGVYVDDIDADIAALNLALKQRVYAYLTKLIIFSLLLIGFSVFLSRLMATRISLNLSAFTDFFRRAATESVQIPEDEIHFSEFSTLCQAANRMIREGEAIRRESESLHKELNRVQKMEAIGLMAGGVAHDLNNILSGVVNIPELLLDKMPTDDPNRKLVELCFESGLRATAVVQDLLTVGRGIVSLQTPYDLSSLVREFMSSGELNDLRKRYPQIEVTADLSPVPVNITCSTMHISKSILNLVGNSMEAIEGSGRVTLTTRLSELTSPIFGYQEIPPGIYGVLIVADSGPGITEKDRERIFEPFYTRKEMGKSGTGLGLAIVWNAVQDHHGFIDLNTNSEETKFSLYFPLSDRINTIESKQPDNRVPRGQGERILVVDDEAIQRQVASSILEHIGYSPLCLNTGEEAIAYLKENTADLVILDMMLGTGMNGYQTYLEITKFNPGQPALIATGYARTDDVEAALEIGAAACIHKPYLQTTLGKAVADALKDKTEG